MVQQGQDRKDSLEVAGLEDFGQPGWKEKCWLAITNVEIFKRNDREML